MPLYRRLPKLRGIAGGELWGSGPEEPAARSRAQAWQAAQCAAGRAAEPAL
jgi:hypothetical protein